MASDILFGRKPAATGDTSVGEVGLNETRLTWLATPSSDYWVTHLGAHVGWDGIGTPPSATIVAYNASGAGIASTLKAKTAAVQTKAPYKPSNAYGGENLQLQLPQPVIFKRNSTYMGGVHAGVRHMTMGQNADGSMMSRDHNSGTTPPATFTTDRRDAQGRLAMWAVARINSAPNRPSSPSPAPNSAINTTRPVIEADFRDPDESLTGFGIGSADKLDAYQVVVYNSDKSVTHWNSGIVPSTVTERNKRRFTIQPPAASPLPTGDALIWARVRDLCGAWSQPLEWRVTVTTGGALEPTSPIGRITTQTPSMSFGYSHPDGFDLTAVDVVIYDGSVYIRSATNIAVTPSVASGGTVTIAWPATWAPLPTGTTAYVQARAHSSNGLTGAYNARINSFRVNSPPLNPTNHHPAAGATTSKPPDFRVEAAPDADNDDPAGFTCQATLTHTDTGTVTTFPLHFSGTREGRARFAGSPPTGTMANYGSYSWEAVLTDQYGGTSTTGDVITFTYAEAPIITITEPAGSTVTTSTPVVSFTSTPAASRQRVILVDATTRKKVYDSGLVLATGSHQVGTGLIKNGRTYDITVIVQTGLGVYGATIKTIDAAFPPPTTLANQAVTLEYGAYDGEGEPTVAQLTWDAPIGVTETNFRGYAVYRQEVGEPEPTDPIALVTDYPARSWADDTARMNTTLRYWVTVFKEEGDDLMESEPPATLPEIAMTFRGTIITDITSPAMHRIVSRTWLDRSETPVRAREQHDGWGQYPVVFSGERHYARITGTWGVLNDVGYTASELKNAMISLADPILEQRTIRSGAADTRIVDVLVPRRLCYRDGLGRVLFGTLEIENVKDQKYNPHDVSWTFTETGPVPPVHRPSNATADDVSGTVKALEGIIAAIIGGGG